MCQLFRSHREAQKHGVAFHLLKHGPPGQGQQRWRKYLAVYATLFCPKLYGHPQCYIYSIYHKHAPMQICLPAWKTISRPPTNLLPIILPQVSPVLPEMSPGFCLVFLFHLGPLPPLPPSTVATMILEHWKSNQHPLEKSPSGQLVNTIKCELVRTQDTIWISVSALGPTVPPFAHSLDCLSGPCPYHTHYYR